MKVKVSEATGQVLNFMVAKATGMCVLNHDGSVFWGNFATVTPTTSWAQAGPIIEREIAKIERFSDSLWEATTFTSYAQHFTCDGPTPLIAACRCYVASKLGDEIEIPEELK